MTTLIRKYFGSVRPIILIGVLPLLAALQANQHNIAKDNSLEARAFSKMSSIRHPDLTRQFVELVNHPDFNPNAEDKSHRTFLILAAIFERMDYLQLLIDRGADVNAASTGGRQDTVLMWSNTTDIAELLLKNGASLQSRNRAGENVLMVSLWRKKYDVADLFITKGLDINDVDHYARTALMKAALAGNIRTICFLLSRGVDTQMRDKNGDTAASLARKARQKQAEKLLDGKVTVAEQEEILQFLEKLEKHPDPVVKIAQWIRSGKLDPNYCDQSERTLLQLFVVSKMPKTVQFLLQNGADVNLADDSGNTPIFFVKDKEMAVMLLNAGADLNVRNKRGESPLIKVLMHSDEPEKLLDFFISKGNSVDDVNLSGRSVLMEAADYGREDLVRLLLIKGANAGLRDQNGQTALDLARSRNRGMIVKILGMDRDKLAEAGQPGYVDGVAGLLAAKSCTVKELKENMNARKLGVNAFDANGISLLMWAVHYNQPRCFKYLIQQKADVNAQDSKGRTALMYAVTSGNREAVDFLLGNGADVNIADSEGQTAYQLVDPDQPQAAQILGLIKRAQRKTRPSPK